MHEAGKKTMQEGNTSFHNSFSVLDNVKIISLATLMGVLIPSNNFDIIDIMKDLENARHALNKIKNVPCVEENDDVGHMDEVQMSEIPLLDWYQNDSEAEHFTLV
jgi:3-polyprenyl-4-hydroxybenzoate decarboxylase